MIHCKYSLNFNLSSGRTYLFSIKTEPLWIFLYCMRVSVCVRSWFFWGQHLWGESFPPWRVCLGWWRVPSAFPQDRARVHQLSTHPGRFPSKLLLGLRLSLQSMFLKRGVTSKPRILLMSESSIICLLLRFLFLKTGVLLLYNTVLVSAAPRNESAVCIQPLSRISLSPSVPDCLHIWGQRARSRALCAVRAR